MKTAFSKSICLLASILLALALTLSCSDSPSGGGDPFAGNDEYDRYKERLKYYDPADEDQRCNNGVTEFICDVNGGTWYNPLRQHCCESETCDENGCTYTASTLGTILRCGNSVYASNHDYQRCQGEVLQEKCENGEWYNSETQYCDRNVDWNDDNYTATYTVKAKDRCGSEYYEPDEYTDCQNGVVVERCGGWGGEEPLWYNYETQYCSYDNGTFTVKPKTRCGSEYINEDYERCDNEVILERCDSMMGENVNWYNYITQVCDWSTGTVRNKVRCSN